MKDWQDFKIQCGSIEGARAEFEKVCASLFRKIYPNRNVRLVTIKNGDGGIDVLIGEIGVEPITVIQCKFFLDKVDSSQQEQIRKSYKRASENSDYVLKNWILFIPKTLDIYELKWWSGWKDRTSKKINKDQNFITLITGEQIIDLLKDHNLYNRIFQIDEPTGQLVSIDEFVQYYNNGSQSIATPLDNPFLFRENELSQFINTLEKENFIVLSGKAGIGKTRIAIEGLKKFQAQNPNYEIYSLLNRHISLFKDLRNHFENNGQYILFIDDANRIEHFREILGFCKTNTNLKIVLTIRDYSMEFVDELIPYTKITTLRINDTLERKEIESIISRPPFSINDFTTRDKILNIADGNPRIAIMLIRLVKQDKNIQLLSNIGQLFELYYRTFINDNQEFSKPINIRCLGLISFFDGLPTNKKETTLPILEKHNISIDEFISSTNTLTNLELLENQYDFVKISEQNIGFYLLYRAFFKDSSLSFYDLLINHFQIDTKRRFKDKIIAVNNIYGFDTVSEYIKTHLEQYWETIKTDENLSFAFLSVFWIYLQDLTLSYLHTQINSTEYSKTNDNNNILISLLSDFYNIPSKLNDALELSWQFIKTTPTTLNPLIEAINTNLSLDFIDRNNLFYRQNSLFKSINKNFDENPKLYFDIFYALAKNFLTQTQLNYGSKNSFDYPIYKVNTESFYDNTRTIVWTTINSNKNIEKCLDILEQYSQSISQFHIKTLEHDFPFFYKIALSIFSPKSFIHCKVIQQIICEYSMKEVRFTKDLSKLSNLFTNPTYKTYSIIRYDFWFDNNKYPNQFNHETYSLFNNKKIERELILSSIEDIQTFLTMYSEISKALKGDFHHENRLDYIIDIHLKKDFDFGFHFFKEIIVRPDISFIPNESFRKHLSTEEKINKVWSLIQASNFEKKAYWELRLYQSIPNSLQSKTYINHILRTIKNLPNNTTFYFSQLIEWQKNYPTIFESILIITNERVIVENIKIVFLPSVFSVHYPSLGKNLSTIKDAYLNQIRIQNSFDSGGKGLINIIKQDNSFLLNFTKTVYEENLNFPHRLSGIWEICTIEKQLEPVFDFIISKTTWYNKTNLNSFFVHIDSKHLKRADTFILNNISNDLTNTKKISLMLDIARNQRKQLVDKILITFVSSYPSLSLFKKIQWKSSSTIYSSNVYFGDISASFWQKILSVIENADLGYKSLEIRLYLKEKIKRYLDEVNEERRNKFISGN
jgi:hypothetical protein